MSPFPAFSKLLMQPSEPKGIRSHYTQYNLSQNLHFTAELKDALQEARRTTNLKLKSHILGCEISRNY